MPILLIALVVILLILCFKMMVGDRKFLQARAFEKEGKFREACYFYAVAMFNGAASFQQCRSKILELWRAHGPFDYADIDAQACRLDCQGHSETLKIIMEVVTSK